PFGLSLLVFSLWRCPARRLDSPLASTLPFGARTFLRRVLKAPAYARAALTGLNSNARRDPRLAAPAEGRLAAITPSLRRWRDWTSRPRARSPRAGRAANGSDRSPGATGAPRHAAALGRR